MSLLIASMIESQLDKTMTSKVSIKKRGFTLLELTIGLAVIGLLLGGLFQLSAAGSRQINDQLTAQQMQAYMRAAKSFLAARTDNPQGTSINFYNSDCTDLLPATATAVGGTYNITQFVQCFRPNALPLLSPSAGTYKVMMVRSNDISSGGVQYATYTVVVSVTDGNVYSRVSLGQIATYIGAEGAASYPSGETADNPNTVCNENTQNTIRGGFGGNCINMATFGTEFQALKPATLSYVSMLDVGTDDTRYLWRINGPTAAYNQMTVNMGMVGTPIPGIYFGAAPAIVGGITGLTGGLSLAATPSGPFPASSITGVTGGINMANATPIANAITGVIGGIQTGGGSIDTGGGDLTLGGGDIATGGGGLTTGGGPINTSSGTITAGEGNFTVLNAGSFIYTSSDRQIKKDIQQLSDPLPQLLKIKGVSYTLKRTDEKTMGVIAQDVEEVYPELVREKDGVKQVNYNGLIGPIIESLRQLRDENEVLKKRIEALEQNR